jgi:hypothetical protein
MNSTCTISRFQESILRASLTALVISAIAMFVSCGGGGSPDKTTTPTTPPAASTPPTFYLKLTTAEIGIGDQGPNSAAQSSLGLQKACNRLNQIEGRPTSPPPPDSADLSKIDLDIIEYWSLNGKMKKLVNTPRLQIDKTTCEAKLFTEQIAYLGDATTTNTVDYNNKTVRTTPFPAYEGPLRSSQSRQDKRTIAGELCSYAPVPSVKGESCSWDRLESWRFIGGGSKLFNLLSASFNIKEQATQIELAPAISPDTFDIPAGFKRI